MRLVNQETGVGFELRYHFGGDRWPDVIHINPNDYTSHLHRVGRFEEDEVLRRFGLWFTGDHHADRRSASRHVLRYLLKNHPPSAEFGWGWIKEKT